LVLASSNLVGRTTSDHFGDATKMVKQEETNRLYLMHNYEPPFTITNTILKRVADISEIVGRLSLELEQEQNLRLRRINQIRTIQGSLAIEGSTLSTEQITAILEGKRVIAPPKEITEARNAIAAYEQLGQWQATTEKDLLAAHQVLMVSLVDDPG